MHRSLHEFDDRNEGFELVGEGRGEDYPRRDRRFSTMLLAVFAMALFAGGLWFAYVQGSRHATVGSQADGVPLIRADTRPDKVKPEQPGGMAIPDQNVSLYDDKPGAAAVEKLLPAPEQPMPRPAPPPKEAAASPAAVPATTPADSPPAALPPTGAAAAKPAAQAKAAAQPKPAAPPKPAVAQTAAAQPAKTGPIQLRLGSVRSPEAARDEWSRLKRENSDLLGKLTAVAVRTDLGDKGIYYRIEAGPLGDAVAAERLCGELKRRKLGCLLAR